MATDLGTTDSFEDELDRIRLKIYEETKGMTPHERQVYMTEKTEPIIKKYGMRTMTIDEVRARGGLPPLSELKSRRAPCPMGDECPFRK